MGGSKPCSLVTTTWLLAPSDGSFCKDTLPLSSKDEPRTSAWETFPALEESTKIATYFLETAKASLSLDVLYFFMNNREEEQSSTANGS